MNETGRFLFEGNISLTPYEFGKEFTYHRVGQKALDTINFLCPNESEFTNTPNHLFSVLKTKATIGYVKLSSLIFGIHAGYATYIGTSHGDLNEIYRGVSDTFSTWVPDAMWNESCTSEIIYSASTVHKALLGRAERLKNMASIDELLSVESNSTRTVPNELLFHYLERSYAKDYPDRDPICHIAIFGDLPEIFVQNTIDHYQVLFTRAGLIEPFIGNSEKEYFKFVVGHLIRNVISNLVDSKFIYVT